MPHGIRLVGIVLAMLTCAVAFHRPALAQGSGANVNFLTPVGLQTLTVSYLESNSNFRFGQTGFDEFSIETNTGTLGWAWRFGLFGRLSVVGVGLNYVDISAIALVQPAGGRSVQLAGRSRGLGDPRLSLRTGLAGTPALAPDAWLDHEPGFQLSGELGVRLPLGDYDERRVLNPGYNRTAWDFSLPSVLPLDGARRTTFLEFTPKVIWFGDNTEAPLFVERSSQDPLYVGEMHVSHHLGGRWWFSLGVQYQNGGETFLDGEAQDNAIDQWFGEAGLGLVLNRHLSFSMGYGRIFAAGNDSRGEAWRIRLGILL